MDEERGTLWNIITTFHRGPHCLSWHGRHTDASPSRPRPQLRPAWRDGLVATVTLINNPTTPFVSGRGKRSRHQTEGQARNTCNTTSFKLGLARTARLIFKGALESSGFSTSSFFFSCGGRSSESETFFAVSDRGENLKSVRRVLISGICWDVLAHISKSSKPRMVSSGGSPEVRLFFPTAWHSRRTK